MVDGASDSVTKDIDANGWRVLLHIANSLGANEADGASKNLLEQDNYSCEVTQTAG